MPVTDRKVFYDQNPELEEGINEIHFQMIHGELDVRQLIKMYAKNNPKEAVTRLLADIQELSYIYENMLEEVKKCSVEEAEKTSSLEAEKIRRKYEALRIVPKEFLPRTALWDMGGAIRKVLSKFGRAILIILSEFSSDIIRELNFQPGTTVVVQATLGWPPSVVIGHERNV